MRTQKWKVVSKSDLIIILKWKNDLAQNNKAIEKSGNNLNEKANLVWLAANMASILVKNALQENDQYDWKRVVRSERSRYYGENYDRNYEWWFGEMQAGQTIIYWIYFY